MTTSLCKTGIRLAGGLAVLVTAGVLFSAAYPSEVWARRGEERRAEQAERAEQTEPAVRGSVRVPSEEAQAARLASVTIEEAAVAARAAAHGTVVAAELEDEDGTLVWTVDIAGEDNQVHEVLVDAGNKRVLRDTVENDDEQGGEERGGGHED